MAQTPAPKKGAPRKTPAKKAAKTPKPTAPNKARAGAAASTPDEPAPAVAPPALNERQQRFVDEYLVDLNGTQAAIRAGYSRATAAEQAYDLLRKPQIQAAIAAARRAQQERIHITADRLVLELANIVLADPRELVEVKVGCCRCCYGEGHKRQRTLLEMATDRERWAEKDKPAEEFDQEGGIGFNPLLLPHPDCPACGGDGDARAVLKDTRHISARAAALYAGAKATKYGIEVQMHDKGAAMEKLARHLGIYERDNQQKADPLTALLHAIATGNASGFAPQAHDPERPTPADKPSAFVPRADDMERD